MLINRALSIARRLCRKRGYRYGNGEVRFLKIAENVELEALPSSSSQRRSQRKWLLAEFPYHFRDRSFATVERRISSVFLYAELKFRNPSNAPGTKRKRSRFIRRNRAAAQTRVIICKRTTRAADCPIEIPRS